MVRQIDAKSRSLDKGNSRQAGRSLLQAPEAQQCVELAAMIDSCCNAALTVSAIIQCFEAMITPTDLHPTKL